MQLVVFVVPNAHYIKNFDFEVSFGSIRSRAKGLNSVVTVSSMNADQVGTSLRKSAHQSSHASLRTSGDGKPLLLGGSSVHSALVFSVASARLHLRTMKSAPWILEKAGSFR